MIRELDLTLQLYLVLLIVTGPLVWLLKLSIFSLIYNIFPPLAYIRRLLMVGLVFSGLYYITAAIASGVSCAPRDGQDRLAYFIGLQRHACSDPTGTVQIFSITTALIGVIVDIYLLLLPLRAISQLHLQFKKKLCVFLIFSTGTGCVACSIMHSIFADLDIYSACIMSVLVLYYRSHGFYLSKVHPGQQDINEQSKSMFIVWWDQRFQDYPPHPS